MLSLFGPPCRLSNHTLNTVFNMTTVRSLYASSMCTVDCISTIQTVTFSSNGNVLTDVATDFIQATVAECVIGNLLRAQFPAQLLASIHSNVD